MGRIHQPPFPCNLGTRVLSLWVVFLLYFISMMHALFISFSNPFSHRTSLTRSLCNAVSVESEQSYLCLLRVSIFPLSMVLVLNFGTVPTVNNNVHSVDNRPRSANTRSGFFRYIKCISMMHVHFISFSNPVAFSTIRELFTIT